MIGPKEMDGGAGPAQSLCFWDSERLHRALGRLGERVWESKAARLIVSRQERRKQIKNSMPEIKIEEPQDGIDCALVPSRVS